MSTTSRLKFVPGCAEALRHMDATRATSSPFAAETMACTSVVPLASRVPASKAVVGDGDVAVGDEATRHVALHDS